MQLKDGALKSLQKYIELKIKERGFKDETLHERLVLLMEEVGELAKACRKISGMNIEKGKENSHMVGEEIADVINLTFAVAIKLELDVEKEFEKKEEKNDMRSYHRAKI
jgi:NTP pyrophosphatase (non-canonical NTP hydrolase)